MLERLVILLIVALAILAGWGLFRLWRADRLRRLQTTSPLAGLAPLGRPAIVAFSTPTCGECRALQAPALARLAAMVGDAVTIRSLSALDHPDLVERVGILTVPATVVIDAGGTIRHLNLGYAAESKLHEQVRVLRTTC
jgi:thiol-disulfide isomerase/thioredoxin